MPRISETRVFVAAIGVALVHALDDAFLNRQPGVELNQHVFAAALALVVGGVGMLAFPRARPGVRAGLALAFGILAFANGVLHVIHIGTLGPARSDLTGLLATLAGVALIGLGIWIPWRHRGERPAGRRRRWAIRLLAAVAGLAALYVVVFPSVLAIVQTHKFREALGDPPPGYEPVTFRSSDGLDLSGWYRPSENGAAVIVVHGGGGDRTGSLSHAALLARHGYGVLAYDSRGRGVSEGSPNAFGWGWEKDVAGALSFVGQRDDVGAGRIGALGLSTGADVLLEVAAEHRELKAVVGDGATMRSFADSRAVNGLDATSPFFWSLLTAARVLSGSSPGPPLEDLVPRVSPTPLLLIAAGSLAGELDANRHYAAVAKEPFELWELPEVNHTAAVRERPAEYEERVVGFFDRALGG